MFSFLMCVKLYCSQSSKYLGVVDRSVELSSKNFLVLVIKSGSYSSIELINVSSWFGLLNVITYKPTPSDPDVILL